VKSPSRGKKSASSLFRENGHPEEKGVMTSAFLTTFVWGKEGFDEITGGGKGSERKEEGAFGKKNRWGNRLSTRSGTGLKNAL